MSFLEIFRDDLSKDRVKHPHPQVFTSTSKETNFTFFEFGVGNAYDMKTAPE
jgi:hypothetical protein